MLVADGKIALFGSRLVDWERGEKIVLSGSRPSQEGPTVLEPSVARPGKTDSLTFSLRNAEAGAIVLLSQRRVRALLLAFEEKRAFVAFETRCCRGKNFF
jgi:hypothetical protein